MNSRLPVYVQKMLFHAVVSDIIIIQDFTVPVPAPGKIAGFVIIGLTNQVVPVVICISNSAVSLTQADRLAGFIQVFTFNHAFPVVPCIPFRRIAFRAFNRVIIQIQICFRQCIAVFVHGTVYSRVTCAHICTFIIVIQICQPYHILVFIILILNYGISILEQRRTAGSINICHLPDFPLNTVLITDPGISGRNLYRQAMLVQIGFTDLPVLCVIGINNSRISHRSF